jgi:hypothetical protein
MITLDFPIVVAVIDDEQLAAGLARAFGHGFDASGSDVQIPSSSDPPNGSPYNRGFFRPS